MKFDSLFGTIPNSKGNIPYSHSRIVFWASILLAALFLYLALRNLEWKVFFSTLKNAKFYYLPFLFLWTTLSYVVRAYRWKILLSAEKPISAFSVFLANMAGYLGNTILPARTGELVRAAYIGKKEDFPISFVLATGLTERLMDVVALVILGALSMSFTGLVSSTLQASLNTMSLIGIVSLLGIVLLPRFANFIEYLVNRFPVLSAKQKEKLYSVIHGFLTGLASLSDIKRAAAFIGLTSIIWFADATGTVFLSYALSLSLTFPQAFILLAALGLSSAIPSTPGYVGIYQFAAILALTPFGVSEAGAVALVLVSQIINLTVVGIWGMIAIGRFGRTSNAA